MGINGEPMPGASPIEAVKTIFPETPLIKAASNPKPKALNGQQSTTEQSMPPGIDSVNVPIGESLVHGDHLKVDPSSKDVIGRAKSDVEDQRAAGSMDAINGAEKDEAEKQLGKLCSMECFPQKTQEIVQAHLGTYNLLLQRTKNLDATISKNLVHIQGLVGASKNSANSVDAYGFPNYLSNETVELLPYLAELDATYKALNENRVPNGLDCDEAIDASSQVSSVFNQCAEVLADTRRFSDKPAEQKAALRRQVEENNARINDEYMSHVTGYEPLVDIIRSGHLMSKARQLQVNGRAQLTITSKPGQEMHQIVFDRRSIRPEYSSPEGRAKVPPVIFITESSTILRGYQGMESDGWHAFGREHDTKSGVVDDFDENLSERRFAVLVPEEYRHRLYEDLSGSYPDAAAIEERLKELNVIFMEQSLYKKPDGSLYGHDDMQQNRPEVKNIYDLAKKVLPTHRNIKGRLIVNGNTGHGSAVYDKPLSSFVTTSFSDANG